jgi:hypothetical protein
MSEYKPKITDLSEYESMARHEYAEMAKPSVTLAHLRAALRFFNKRGAIKASWLERQDMLTERMETSADLDEQLRDLITPYVGENGDTEDLVQTLQRIIDERGNVKRNRERQVTKIVKTMTLDDECGVCGGPRGGGGCGSC